MAVSVAERVEISGILKEMETASTALGRQKMASSYLLKAGLLLYDIENLDFHKYSLTVFCLSRAE